MAVGIDSMILIWAVAHTPRKGKRPTKQDVAEMQKRSKILLHELHEDQESVIVSHISVSELLRGIDPNKHGSFLDELAKQFDLAPFDLPASARAAQLYQAAESEPKPPDDEEVPERACVKADIMIVATAKIAGASVFYSHDKRIRRFAELAGMVPKDLPTAGRNLWTEAEMNLSPTKKK